MPKLSIEEKILKSLKIKKEQNILDLAQGLALDRHTVAKYLEVLKSKGLVKYSTKGKSKIWSLNENEFSNLLGINDFVSNQVLSVLNKLDFDVSIQSKNYDVIWHNSKDVKGKCYEIKRGKKIPCKDCASSKVFETGDAHTKLIKRQGKELLVLSEPIKNEHGDVIAVLEISKKG